LAEEIIPISVVIPLFNKENYIQRAIRSVLGQTYSHFELIVVDDGSTDHSYQSACEIQDSRLQIVRQTNAGASAARNRGVAEARYEWVAFLDADDEWTPEFLELMIDLHNSFPTCGLLGTAFVHFREWGLDDSHQRQLAYPVGWRGILQNYYQDLMNPPFCSTSVVVKKKLLVKIGGFPVFLHKGEDTNTWIRLYQETEFAFTNRIGAIYHLEAENRSIPRPTLIDGDPRKPYSHAILLGQLIREKKIPPAQIQSAVEYMALSDLPVSQQLIEQGFNREARQRLWLYRNTRIYRNRWNRLFIASCIPPVFLRFYRRLTNR
jgi:glycosyltransferase involved in cell wall biosynthesis